MAVNKMYPLEAGVRVAMYCKTNAVGVNFTAFGIGSGENLSPETATELTKEEKRIPVTSVKKIDYGRYRIRGELSNTDLTEDILYRELGLYCVDPENGGEVLYTYGNAKGADFDYTETIRCFADYGITVSKIFEIDIIIDNYIDPTFTIDDSGKVDIATVDELVKDVERLEQEVETLKNSSGSDSGEAVEALTNDVENIKELIPDEANTENKLVDKAYVDSAIGVGGGASNAETFTYVVDSDQALAEWANNVEGNDYTSVLIRKGTWTSDTGVNLTTTGTKVVVGEAGSKLVFNFDTYDFSKLIQINEDYNQYMFGLYYENNVYDTMYSMRNVHVELTLPDNSDGMSHCCGSAFLNCQNLYNCYGETLNTNGGVDMFMQSNAVGFAHCSNLNGCIGKGNSTQITTDDGFFMGDYDCSFGFFMCTGLDNCYGLGICSKGMTSGGGYAFSSCYGMRACRAFGHCQSDTMQSCYASIKTNSSCICADTANGGFNDTTNPSA